MKARRKLRSTPSREKAAVKRLAKKPFSPFERRGLEDAWQWRPRGPKWRDDCYLNNRYSVQISDHETSWGPVVHLWIRRHDEKMPRSWADLQRIKNEIIGKDRVAVEVFPSEDEFVNAANMAHLWVLPKGFILPFTL